MEENITMPTGQTHSFHRHTIATPDGMIAGNAQNPFMVMTPTTVGNTNYFNPALLAVPTAVKTITGVIKSFSFYNPSNAIAYVQMFDMPALGVTLGTSQPILSYPVPAGGWYDFEPNAKFNTAITLAATTTPTGAVAPSAGVVCNIQTT